MNDWKLIGDWIDSLGRISYSAGEKGDIPPDLNSTPSPILETTRSNLIGPKF